MIISRESITQQLTELFSKETFNEQDFIKLINSYNASPESFYQRLSNILPKDFNLQNLFFLRFNYKKGDKKFQLKKELHLTHQHSPRANEVNEKYCRRWVSLEVLQGISKGKEEHLFDMQISNFPKDNMKYLVLSSATKDPFKENHYRSISIGLLINKQLKRKLNFIADPKIKIREVGVTCERCAIKDCAVRQVPAIALDKAAKNKKTEIIVEELNNKFG